ncbi:MAG: anthranilate phosphoribosyltransferase, partial [Bacteroidaceae bacterium]
EIFGGSTPQEAMKIFDNVLNNTATQSQTNVVVANAAYGIRLITDKPIEECIDIARETLAGGKALNTFKKFIELNS